MFTGQSPFRDKTEYLVFKKILDRNIQLPEVTIYIISPLIPS